MLSLKLVIIAALLQIVELWDGSLGEELSCEIEIQVEKFKLYITTISKLFLKIILRKWKILD